jgi:hypothetical protein
MPSLVTTLIVLVVRNESPKQFTVGITILQALKQLILSAKLPCPFLGLVALRAMKEIL